MLSRLWHGCSAKNAMRGSSTDFEGSEGLDAGQSRWAQVGTFFLRTNTRRSPEQGECWMRSPKALASKPLRTETQRSITRSDHRQYHTEITLMYFLAWLQLSSPCIFKPGAAGPLDSFERLNEGASLRCTCKRSRSLLIIDSNLQKHFVEATPNNILSICSASMS